MQIHEITNAQLDEGLGSWAGNLAGKAAASASAFGQAFSPTSDFKSAMADPKRQQQIKMLSDKVYRGWKAYEKTLLQSNPDARETDMYKQALTAFVVKNLLGNQYLPNIINQAKITALVKQLSGSGVPAKKEPSTGTTPPTTDQAKANPGQMSSAVAASKTGQNMQQMFGQPKGGIQGMQSDLEEASLPLTTTAGTSLPAGQIPGKTNLLKGKSPHPAPPATPVAPKLPVATAAPLNPQKEKDLWLQLTQQAAVATAQAPGTGGKPDDSKTPNDPSAGDARTIAQQLKPSDPAVAQALAAFGSASSSKGFSPNIRPTGNPVADAMLILAGFRGI